MGLNPFKELEDLKDELSVLNPAEAILSTGEKIATGDITAGDIGDIGTELEQIIGENPELAMLLAPGQAGTTTAIGIEEGIDASADQKRAVSRERKRILLEEEQQTKREQQSRIEGTQKAKRGRIRQATTNNRGLLQKSAALLNPQANASASLITGI